MTVLRAALGVVVVAVMGCAILGVGMGDATAEREPAPTLVATAAARARITAGGADVHRGRDLFADEGCDRCHAIAAIGAEGALGPRLDTLDDDLDDTLQSIMQPREDIVDGYPERLMPDDFDERLDSGRLRAQPADDEAGGRGRGRGRGRGGSGGG